MFYKRYKRYLASSTVFLCVTEALPTRYSCVTHGRARKASFKYIKALTPHRSGTLSSSTLMPRTTELPRLLWVDTLALHHSTSLAYLRSSLALLIGASFLNLWATASTLGAMRMMMLSGSLAGTMRLAALRCAMAAVPRH